MAVTYSSDIPGVTDGVVLYFNGKIAIGRVYLKCLSDIEILQNYNATKGRFGL